MLIVAVVMTLLTLLCIRAQADLLGLPVMRLVALSLSGRLAEAALNVRSLSPARNALFNLATAGNVGFGFAALAAWIVTAYGG